MAASMDMGEAQLGLEDRPVKRPRTDDSRLLQTEAAAEPVMEGDGDEMAANGGASAAKSPGALPTARSGGGSGIAPIKAE